MRERQRERHPKESGISKYDRKIVLIYESITINQEMEQN